MALKAKWLAYILVFLTALGCGPARADIPYFFIKLDCPIKDQVIKISIPGLNQGEDADDVVTEIRNGQRPNWYYFDDLAKSQKKITCNLNDNSIVSFDAHQSDAHPRNDNIEMYINDQRSPVRFEVMPMKAEIHFTNTKNYTIQKCPLWPSPDDPKCIDRHVVNGICVKETPRQKGCM